MLLLFMELKKIILTEKQKIKRCIITNQPGKLHENLMQMFCTTLSIPLYSYHGISMARFVSKVYVDLTLLLL